MSERDIRAFFRGAVVAKILYGWARVAPGEYVIATMSGATVHLSVEKAADYCDGLRMVGVEAVFRDSEPTLMDFA